MNKLEKIELLQSNLDSILPDDWEKIFETHEERMDLFERSFDRAESIARQAIALLRSET